MTHNICIQHQEHREDFTRKREFYFIQGFLKYQPAATSDASISAHGPPHPTITSQYTANNISVTVHSATAQCLPVNTFLNVHCSSGVMGSA